ncbi:heterogeneous nuclear ribonucleoprotein A3-like [Coregonus clupeaformis]|uniref:heterogeneous nuclear ribonucleoprotein A3-like n=1 Tax=Coregonus clupeaformis TaxID=59861 RepID=UPI001E1C404A|nr:heterogeneous nuclear ribonucleoprotein A3-like [Coregonus clupeaformis]
MKNMEPHRRVYISLPKKYMTALAKKCKLDHGLFIKDLSTYINEGYLQAYFQRWGSITACTIKKTPQDSDSKSASALGFVMFSSEEEADEADWAGPHYIGGMDVEVKRVVSLKVDMKIFHYKVDLSEEVSGANIKFSTMDDLVKHYQKPCHTYLVKPLL